jgi:hypothetical protein
MATTAKIAEVMFDEALETYEHQMQLLDLVSFEQPAGGMMQNSGNFIWRPVQQHAPIISGWDLTGQEQDIIEEEYPAILGTPSNDFVRQRADDMRDQRFWENRGKESGRRQATELNALLAAAIATQGSMFIRTSATSGYTAVATAQTLMNERQQFVSNRSFVLNDRDQLKFAQDLASRENLVGRPADTWKTGQIGAGVAGFDIFTGSYLPNLTGGADPEATVTGNQSFKPESGSVNATTGVVTNVDYRSATIVISDSSSYNVGDKITFANGGTAVQSVGLADKTATGQAMTFTIAAIPSATSITVYPKPIAANDPALTTTELAYANINTRILNAATVNRINTDASAKTNLFFDKTAVEVLGGNIPAELFKQFDGMKVLSQSMKNGLSMYMVFDGNIATMTFRFRIFTWYGITVVNPGNCGVLVTYSA